MTTVAAATLPGASLPGESNGDILGRLSRALAGSDHVDTTTTWTAASRGTGMTTTSPSSQDRISFSSLWMIYHESLLCSKGL